MRSLTCQWNTELSSKPSISHSHDFGFTISLVANGFHRTERIEGIVKEKDVIESHLPRLPRKRTNPDGKRASWKDNAGKRNPMEPQPPLVSHFTVKIREP